MCKYTHKSYIHAYIHTQGRIHTLGEEGAGNPECAIYKYTHTYIRIYIHTYIQWGVHTLEEEDAGNPDCAICK
jgi:hypothetical protein